MKEVLVLGIGNRLMMDDGIGVYVVDELKKRDVNLGILYIIGETDIYFCLNQINEASYTIIVDAVYLGKKPGTISIIPLQQVFRNTMQPIYVHETHLLNEIKMTGKSIEGVLVGIEPYEINYCPSLSTILQSQFYRVVEEIETIITSNLLAI